MTNSRPVEVGARDVQRRARRAARLALLPLALIGVAHASPASDRAAPNESVQHDVRSALGEAGLRFCHDPNYRMFDEDKDAICRHRDTLLASCPGIAHACTNPSWEEALADEEQGRNSAIWSLLSKTGRLVAPVLEVVFWLALASGLFLLMRTLYRHQSGWQHETLSLNQLPTRPTANATLQSEMSSAELFAQSRQLAAMGELREALHHAYGATVRRLGEGGLISPRRSLTTGEYLRLLGVAGSPRAENNKEASRLLIDLDCARFQDEVDAETANQLITRVHSLLRFAQLSVLSLLLLPHVGCQPSEIPEPPQQPTGPRGYALIEALIERQAGPLHRRVRQVTDIPPETDTVISLGAALRPVEWQTLARFVDGGGHLITIGVPEDMAPAFGLELSPLACAEAPSWPGRRIRALRPWSAVVGFDGDISLASCGALPVAVSHFHGRGLLTVISEPSLFENASLLIGDNAEFALELLGQLEGPVDLLGPLTGRAALNPLESVARAGLTPWLAHIIVLLLLFIWAKGKSFQTPVDPPTKMRRSFLNHAEALALTYQRTHALSAALSHYAQLTAQLLRKRSLGGRLEPSSLSTGVAHHPKEAAEFRRAMTLAKGAHQLGLRPSELLAQFVELEKMTHRVLSKDQQASPRGATEKHSPEQKDAKDPQ